MHKDTYSVDGHTGNEMTLHGALYVQLLGKGNEGWYCCMIILIIRQKIVVTHISFIIRHSDGTLQWTMEVLVIRSGQ